VQFLGDRHDVAAGDRGEKGFGAPLLGAIRAGRLADASNTVKIRALKAI
jgi:hypothetical protein